MIISFINWHLNFPQNYDRYDCVYDKLLGANEPDYSSSCLPYN